MHGVLQMTVAVQNILSTYEQLPEAEKRELAAEIIRRSLKLTLAPLSDDDFVLNAEDIFLELDRTEAKDENSQSRRGVAR